MYPKTKTPDMTGTATQSLSDGEPFAIIENGVRLTGMPGFGSGMDFKAIYLSTAFSFGSFLYVLIVLSIWAYVLGVIYAYIRNWIQPSFCKA